MKRFNILFFNTKKSVILFGTMVGLMVIGLGVTAFGAGKTSTKSFRTYTVAPSEPLVFDGQVRSDDSQTVYNNATYGEIDEIFVKDGQVVNKGQQLLRYKNKETTKQLKQAYRQLERAKENYNVAVEEYDKAAAKYNLKVDDFYETKNPELAATLEQEKATVDGLRKAVLEAQHGVEDASNAISDLEETATHTEKSLIDGTVRVNERAKDNPQSQEPVIQITSKKLVVIGSLSEFDYKELNKNDKVRIVPVNGDEPVMGTVVEKSSSPQESVQPSSSETPGTTPQSSSSAYEFKAIPERPIQNGFSVSIEKTKDDELVVPQECLTEKDGNQAVFVYEDGKAVLREVTLQEKDGVYYVVSGLSKGETILFVTEDLKDGMEVEVNDEPNPDEQPE